MEQWPGNPVVKMEVTQSPYKVSFIPSTANSKQNIVGGPLAFTIDIKYNSSGGNTKALFVAELFKVTTAGWTSMDLQSKLLGGATAGNFQDKLVLTLNATGAVENYGITLKCGSDDSVLTEMDSYLALQATRSNALQGNVIISYVPVSIVYCPPGQDMTNSLTQSKTFGTRFSIGFTSALGWKNSDSFTRSTSETAHTDVNSNSQTSVSVHEDAIQVTHNSNTVITADNQKAIGRAYWGPLGDLFVIMANMQFGVIKDDDGSMLFGPKLDGGEQVLII